MLERALAFETVETAAIAPLLPLEAHGITFEAGGRSLIAGIDLKLRPGMRTVVMGSNGSGKSLLLRLLHGLLQPSGGTVLWNGRPADDAIRRRQAMVFQRPVMLRRSALGNLQHALRTRGLPRHERRRRAEQALEQAQLAPIGHTPARLLSGGEQQRLALARALSLAPEVLFPHDAGQARRLADEIVFLCDGRLEDHAPAAQFFDAPGSSRARAFLEGRIVI
jgi:tungstate transport system ATP-binding protein